MPRRKGMDRLGEGEGVQKGMDRRGEGGGVQKGMGEMEGKVSV